MVLSIYARGLGFLFLPKKWGHDEKKRVIRLIDYPVGRGNCFNSSTKITDLLSFCLCFEQEKDEYTICTTLYSSDSKAEVFTGWLICLSYPFLSFSHILCFVSRWLTYTWFCSNSTRLWHLLVHFSVICRSKHDDGLLGCCSSECVIIFTYSTLVLISIFLTKFSHILCFVSRWLTYTWFCSNSTRLWHLLVRFSVICRSKHDDGLLGCCSSECVIIFTYSTLVLISIFLTKFSHILCFVSRWLTYTWFCSNSTRLWHLLVRFSVICRSKHDDGLPGCCSSECVIIFTYSTLVLISIFLTKLMSVYHHNLRSSFYKPWSVHFFC